MKVKNAVPRHKRIKKIRKASKGFQGQRSRQTKLAMETLQKGSPSSESQAPMVREKGRSSSIW